MNVRMAILIAAIACVVLWAAAFASCGRSPLPKEEPRCKTELISDGERGMRRVERCD